MATASTHHPRIPRHVAIAAAWHERHRLWATQRAELRERRAAARQGTASFLPLPASPPAPPGHRFEWVPTHARQVCALCHAETDLMLVDGASRRVWWVDGVATDTLPSCRALPARVPAAALAKPRRVVDAELPDDADPLAGIVVARAPRPRRPRARPDRPRPAATPRPTHRPSKETQAFLDGEEPEVDPALVREIEQDVASLLSITHEDIAGARELELIIQAQLDAASTTDALAAARAAANRGDMTQLSKIWQSPAMRKARQAADTLLRAHDKLIRMYAGRCARMAAARHGVDFDDMLQEARKGFLHGVYKFSPQHGVKISSYASYWMIQCMGRTLDKTRSLVVLPYNVIERAKRVMRKGLPITPEALAAAGKGTLNPDIAIAGAAVWSGRDISVQETVGGGGDDGEDESTLKVAGYLQSDEDVQERVVEADLAQRRATLVHAALAELTDREREVARRRLMTDPADPLEVIGKDLGMTRENARLIEVRVKSKLAAFLAAQARANDVNEEVLGDPDELEAAAELAAAA